MTDIAVSAALSRDFQVRRDDLRSCRVVPAPVAPDAAPEPGQVLLRVDAFAFTANNVTYAAFGDAMSYWQFFPAPDGWGRIPVWGFADVVASTHDAVAPGERYYGYYPMSTHLLVQPERIGPDGFSDGAAHRKPLHPVYNRYQRTGADPGYDASREPQQMLLRPLFITSFLIDDYLADNGFFGADTVVLSSASSKTAYGTAFLLSRRGRAAGSTERPVRVVGLTSRSNAAFVKRLGCYDEVLGYDEIARLPADAPTAYVDMAGNAATRAAIHRQLAQRLTVSCAVGGTHWDHLGVPGAGVGAGGDAPAGPLPGPKPTLFFAPAQVKKRNADWGPGGLERRVAGAWQAFMQPVTDPAAPWMRVVRGRGPQAVEQVVRQMLDGRAAPDEGHVLTMFD
jgi:hypothetical protein